MNRRIQSALISVFYKDGLEPIVRTLHALGVKLYSTGGTQLFIEGLELPCTSVESVTDYPSILGGRVKTLHPKIFGGILARRGHAGDEGHVAEYSIPPIDLVIVDLYPFEQTVASLPPPSSEGGNESLHPQAIEKIDIGGVSLIRAAAKNFTDVCIVASRTQYAGFLQLLEKTGGETNLEDRRSLAAAAFAECARYDVAIARYFNGTGTAGFELPTAQETPLRYGENPHQKAAFHGTLANLFTKLNGKELSYNNLVDLDAALLLVQEFGRSSSSGGGSEGAAFAVVKHTNACGMAIRPTVEEAWEAALAGDPESAFGGVLVTNQTITEAAAQRIGEIFFEILAAPFFEDEALALLKAKKNRIILQTESPVSAGTGMKRVLNGTLIQDGDSIGHEKWEEAGARQSTPQERADLEFANLVCKHLKSNAIAIVKGAQLIGKGCGQTSRIDALRHSLEKARQSDFSTEGAVMASDAFFPFDDCARMAHEAGITAIVQPGGSIRDKDTIEFCKANDMALVMTGTRHFRH